MTRDPLKHTRLGIQALCAHKTKSSASLMLIDSHCHLDRLDLKPYSGRLSDVLADCRVKGVGHFLAIGIDSENASAVLEIAQSHQDVHCVLGTHPLDIDAVQNENQDKNWLSAYLQDPNVVGIGETGLDYHYSQDNRMEQCESFKYHLDMAKLYELPVVVHTRNAKNDTLQLIKAADLKAAGVLHCFTEDWEMAKAALDLGFYLSFSGIVTFKNADTIRDIVSQVPWDRLLIETDAPYLTPVPERGKPCYPHHVIQVAECIARLRGVDLTEVAAHTSKNFFTLFNKITQNTLK